MNVFATGRLVVAASRRRYFLRIFANQHYVDEDNELEYYRTALSALPISIITMVVRFAEMTITLRLKKQVPMLVTSRKL